MHSFHPSRGRVLFEFACALGMVASFVGAWKQTGASALLLAAFAVGLYGFVRLLDLGHGKPAEAMEQQEAETVPEQPEPDQQAGIRAFLEAVGPVPTVDAMPEVVEPAQAAERVEPVAAEASHASQAKPRRKSGGRKAKAAEERKVVEETKVVEFAPPVEAQVTEFDPLEEVDVAESAPPEEVADPVSPKDAELAEFADPDEAAHPQIAPLFEPEPFARMPRRAFGRRGQI